MKCIQTAISTLSSSSNLLENIKSNRCKVGGRNEISRNI